MRISKATRWIIEDIVRRNTIVAAEDINLLIKTREPVPNVEALISREIAKARNVAVARIRDDDNRRIAFILPGSMKSGVGSLIVNVERSNDKRAFKAISDGLRKKAEGLRRSWEKIQKKRGAEGQASMNKSS